ncbi:MAG: hypothetical protein PHC88_13515, partial [Terrimicrobiaceae bacterium]|nr:hypothetical protein [Terrimicrobiaceae bacterium]
SARARSQPALLAAIRDALAAVSPADANGFFSSCRLCVHYTFKYSSASEEEILAKGRENSRPFLFSGSR